MSDCNRRKFIKHSLLFSAATMIGCGNNTTPTGESNVFTPAPATATTTPNLAISKVPSAVLGKTGVKVPILSSGGTYELNNAMVGRSLELGINYFDTADCYMGGQSEVALGNSLAKQGKRKEVTITSKNHPRQPSQLLETIDERLQKLQTDYLDFYFIHQLGDGEYPKECVDWPKSKELKETAEQLKKQKKINFIGFSCHAGILPQALENAAEGGFIDAIMFRYNFREVSSDALNRAIDKAKKANIGLIAMKTQGGRVSFQEKADSFKEKGFNQFQSALKAVWSDGRIDTIVSSMPSLQVLQDNAIAATQNQISAVEKDLLEEYAKATNHLVCHGCEHICSPHVTEPVRIGDTLRYLMYHDHYQEVENARSLFAKMPRETRAAILRADYRLAEAACPHNLEIGKMMADAARKLA